MKTSVKIEGLKELDEALSELTKATARNVLYKALFKAAKPIDDDWRRMAPEETGALKASGGVVKTLSTLGKSEYGAALAAGGSEQDARAALRAARRVQGAEYGFASVTVGPGRNPQATLQEFGTASQSPQPYFRPAWEGNKEGALQIIKTELTVEIAKAAARAAKKRAKAGG